MASPDVVIMDSHSTTDIPCSTREFAQSASMPDINDIFVHEIINTILSSWCSNHPSSFLDKSHKTDSPVLLSIKVLKAQLFQLKNRLRVLETENHDLRLSNKVLEAELRTINHELSNLRSDYSYSIAEREKLALASKQGDQKIRALVSDVDNAQNFIMAMIDIKLHESFLYDAATSTIENGQDAELALIKAIAQAADTKGSVWSRVIPFLSRVRGTDTYVSAINLALQEMPSEVQTRNAASDACISRGYDDGCLNAIAKGYTHNLVPFGFTQLPPPIINLKVRRLLSHSANTSHVVRPSSIKAGTTECTAKTNKVLSLDSASTQTFALAHLPGPRTSSETSIQAPWIFAKDNILEQSGCSNPGRSTNADKRKGLIKIENAEFLTPQMDFKGETRISTCKDIWVVGTGHSNLELDTVMRSIGHGATKTDTESANDVALPSAITAGNSGLCLTALESLERICATLSNSDLGSLEMTTDDDQSQSEADIGHSSETEFDKTHIRTSTTPTTNETIKTQRGSFLDAMSSFFESDLILGSVAPRSTVPTSLPLVARAEAESCASSNMLTEVSPSTPANANWSTEQQLNQEPPANVRQTKASSRSPDLSKSPAVTGIARLIGGSVHSSQKASRKKGGELNVADSLACYGSVAPSSEHSALASKSHRDATRQCTVRICDSTNSEPTNRHSRDFLSRISIMPSVPKGNSSVAAANKKHSVSKTRTISLSQPPKASGALKRVHGAANSVSKPPSGEKTSTRRGILPSRRPSIIPESVSKSRQFIVSEAPNLHLNSLQVTSLSPSGKPRARSSRNVTSSSSLLSEPSDPNPQTLAAASDMDRISTPPKINIARHANAKSRSNTINTYSPAKSSPLSQNVIIVSSDLESESTLTRKSTLSGEKPAPSPTSGHASALQITGGSPVKSILLLRTARFMTKSAVPKAQIKKNANTSTALAKLEVSSRPTAAFMKPVDHLSARATKRMTNSIKPLIPTWTPGMSTPAQCRRMFRNSLSMVVR